MKDGVGVQSTPCTASTESEDFMSEQINKVLASTAQAFSTAEQKQARDNIGAQQSGDYVYASAYSSFSAHVESAKQDASAMSAYVPYSAISADADSAITSINGSSVGKFTGVSAGDNLSGNGLSSSPLGLNSSIVFTSSNRQNTIQADKMEFTAKVNPLVFSGTYRPWGWDISGSSTSTNEKTAVVQNTSYFSMYTTSDGGEKAQGYLTFRGCGFGESGTGGAGDEIHTNISTLGITSISGYMGTASSHTGFYLTNGNDPDRPLELKFESGSSTAKVDIDSIDRWNSYSAATRVVSRSYPYSDDVNYTSLTIYNPSQTYGATIQDPSSTTIGYFVPKYLAPADLGKVLTVVSDDGYKCEWKDPTGGIPEITPMGQTTVYLSDSTEYLTMEDGVAYWLETTAGGSFTVHLGTQSTRTIHNKLYLVGTQANCVTMTIVYEDEAGQVQQLNFVYGDTLSDTIYALDVYSRKVTLHSGGMTFETTMCRVIDYPCQTRDYFSSDNNKIGLIEYYVE